MFTPEAMKDERYRVRQHREELLVHPREWYEAWGYLHPLIWKPFNHSKGKRVETRLYPFYSPEYGWEWVSESSFKHTHRRTVTSDQKNL